MLGLTERDMRFLSEAERERVRKELLDLMKVCVESFRFQGMDAAEIARRLSREMEPEEMRAMGGNMLVIGEEAVSVALYERAEDAEEEAGYAYLAVKGGAAL